MENSLNALYTHTFNDEGLELSIAAEGTLRNAKNTITRYGLELGGGEWQGESTNPNSTNISLSANLSVPLPNQFSLDAGLAYDLSAHEDKELFSMRSSTGGDWLPIDNENTHSLAMS